MRVKAIWGDTSTEWYDIDFVLNDVQIAGAHWTMKAADRKRYLWVNPAFVKAVELTGDEGNFAPRPPTMPENDHPIDDFAVLPPTTRCRHCGHFRCNHDQQSPHRCHPLGGDPEPCSCMAFLEPRLDDMTEGPSV